MVFLCADWRAHEILQYYKLNMDPAVSSAASDADKQHSVVDELVTSFVAMKSVMS